MTPKQPHSIQVVIFSENSEQREYLVLRRITNFGRFWQTVTGSLEVGETHKQAASREVLEETGISCKQKELIDLNLVNMFELHPEWLPKYEPGVTQNEEVCFALKVDRREIRLDQFEHDEYAWVDYNTAMGLLYWPSSKLALAAAAKLLEGQSSEG